MSARETFNELKERYAKNGFFVAAHELSNGCYDLTCLDPDGLYDSVASTVYEFEEGDGKEVPDRYRHAGTTPGCFFSEWEEL